MQKVVLATTNPNKVCELSYLLAHIKFMVIAQTELGVSPIKETGLTFIENAILKARHAVQVTGLPAISDDSGLVVDALGGAPGIHSARYAGNNASDQQNRDKLLAALEGVPHGSRSARFYCVLVYMRQAQDPIPLVYHGSWLGEITIRSLTTGGFGYDPIFYLAELGCTAAELSYAKKSKLSHRAKALKLMLSSIHST